MKKLLHRFFSWLAYLTGDRREFVTVGVLEVPPKVHAIALQGVLFGGEHIGQHVMFPYSLMLRRGELLELRIEVSRQQKG